MSKLTATFRNLDGEIITIEGESLAVMAVEVKGLIPAHHLVHVYDDAGFLVGRIYGDGFYVW